jgi:AraC-like DNA-binding protein
MVNNTTFFVRQPAAFSTAKADAEMAFYCMLTGNACININMRLHQGQYTLINDHSIPLLLNLEPGIYELHQYGYAKTHLINLAKVSYPRTIFIQLLQAINEVKITRIHSSLTEIWLETKLREILILFLDDHFSPQKEEYLDFINNNLDKEISISKLTKMYYISESTLRRSFIKKFGISFSLYLQKVRLEKGEELLARTNKHIHEIALQVGYRSAAAFTHAFKQHFGYTPTSIRERHAITN